MTAPRAASAAVLAVSGYAVRISVASGHLCIRDGVSTNRREIRLSRVNPDLRRLVVHGHAGTISLDALCWLRDTGIAFTHVDHDGAVIAMSGPGSINDVRVRRGQALASTHPLGVDLGRLLIEAKVERQRSVLRDRGGHAKAVTGLTDALEILRTAASIVDIRFLEARAAAMYWDAWDGVPIRFAARDRARVPGHWLTFTTRHSQISASQRKASDPINALLNYTYGILEAEAQLASVRVGCDPAMGVIHSDKLNRASFACDLMEPIRPLVDSFVLTMLEKRTFRADDFFETREGNCRLMPPLANALAQTAPQWAAALGALAERAASAFAHIPLAAPQLSAGREAPRLRLRTPLTQQNRKRKDAAAQHHNPALEVRCKDCGASLGKRLRAYCDSCLPKHANDAIAKAVVVQAQLRAVGEDRRQSPEVRATHSQQALESNRRNAAWEALHTSLPSPVTFDRELLPRLLNIPAVAIRDATGLGLSSAKTIKAGRMRPHPRHWEALRRLVDTFAVAEPQEWEALPSDFFAREIAPRLLELPAEAIQAATGLSVSYSRRLRSGHHIPHRKYWSDLRRLLGGPDA